MCGTSSTHPYQSQVRTKLSILVKKVRMVEWIYKMDSDRLCMHRKNAYRTFMLVQVYNKGKGNPIANPGICNLPKYSNFV